MDKQYSVDDILEEVRQKRGVNASAARVSSSKSTPVIPSPPPFEVGGLEEGGKDAPGQTGLSGLSVEPADKQEDRAEDADWQPLISRKSSGPTMAEKWTQSAPAASADQTRVLPPLEPPRSASGRLSPEDMPARTRELADAPEATEEPGGERAKPSKGWFRRGREEEPEPRAEQPGEEIDDFNSMEDVPSIEKDIRTIRASLVARLLITGACFLTLFYLALSVDLPLPLPRVIFPELDMRMFVLANLGVMIAATLACNPVVGGGLISLLTFKADGDSPAALATLLTIANGVALAVTPAPLEEGRAQMFFAVAALSLVFNTIGKLQIIERVERNFRVMISDKPKVSIQTTFEPSTVHGMAGLMPDEEEAMIYQVKTEFPSEFLEISYGGDYAEGVSRMVTPLFFGFSVVMSAVSYLIFNRDAMAALTAFNALCCVTSPLTAAMVGNFPLWRASSKLQREGSALSGYAAAEQMDGARALALDAADLFPPGSVELHGIKTFAQGRIDEAILDAASVMCEARGLLTDIFMQIIGSDLSMLKPSTPWYTRTAWAFRPGWTASAC
jgi:hypothetical protein